MELTVDPVAPATPSSHWLEQLECPACGRPLRMEAERLRCPGCNESTPIVDGVPHFIREFPYWGEMPFEQVLEVNRQAENGSWRSALLDSPDPQVKRASEMILNLDRANWHMLLNLPAESRVLDIGAGMGTNSHALAKRFRDVVAVEPVFERIRFMRQRFAQEGLSNIRLLRSSIWKLPFPRNSFDLVAMNGVLEWVAQGVPGNPETLQRTALEHILRVLRPGGWLYLGIENRTAAGYFLGYPDPHCGLPWVTILPRGLANWYARRRGQSEGYRNYLYSSQGYAKLLRKAGFSQVKFYTAAPSYNDPRFLIPFDDAPSSYYMQNFSGSGAGLRGRLGGPVLRHTGVRKHLAYAYAILARKDA